MMPGLPEAVTYSEYEEQRDSGLPPSSIHIARSYTVRLRAPEPTVELFAHDMVSLISHVQHLGKYSLVLAKVLKFDRRVELERLGVSPNGIVFRSSPLPEDLDPIPYAAERGYFVGEMGGIGSRGEISDHELEETEVNEWLAQVALTR